MQWSEEVEQLSLFGDDDGGVCLARLKAARQSLSVVRRAPRTVAAYGSDWRVFCRWCAVAGRESLPASADTLSLYVTWMLVEQGRKVSTAERHVSAVRHFHREASLPNPVSEAVRTVLSAVKRERRERPAGKAALDVPDLVKASRSCDVSTVQGLRDRALIVLGFATSLRRSELARLQLSDISFERRGVAVLVRYSKGDQAGRGRVIGVWSGKRACTDPVRVLQAWIAKRGSWAGPLFCRVQTGDKLTHRGITGEAINEIVKRALDRAGLDPAPYGAHSLRAGAVTAAAGVGREDREIMRLSGHESATVMKGYIRHARVFSGRNPLQGVL